MDILNPPLKIVHYPHPSLRHPAKPLTGITNEIRRVAEAMLELMYAERGLGLAAPQVGLPFQMFVANYLGDPAEKDAEGVYINPVIVEGKGAMEGEEGCLSFPKLFQKVKRSRIVKAQAYNLRGELLEIEVAELPSRIWQHEVDHLHGKLFIDKFGPLGRIASRSTMTAFEREYKRAQEKGYIPPDAEIEQRLTELEKLA